MSQPESNESGPVARPLNVGRFATPPSRDGDDREGQTVFLKRAAADAAERSLGADAAVDTEFGLPLQQMLGVITYCYARGLFCSPDIADRLRSDPELRSQFGRSLPDAVAIRGFRRRYAAEIEDTLEALYRTFPPAVPGTASPDTEIVHRQAVERLHDASWADNTKGRLG